MTELLLLVCLALALLATAVLAVVLYQFSRGRWVDVKLSVEHRCRDDEDDEDESGEWWKEDDDD